MTPVFVSFYTPAYAAEAAGLVESLVSFGLPHDVRAVPSLGTWERNCGHKPSFMLGMMDKWPARPLVWLDADARVRRRPILFDNLHGADVAFHRRHGCELLTGTLYLGPTVGARRILTRWQAECRFFPEKWDQACLDVALRSLSGIVVESLPASYVRVFDDPKMGEPHIEHRQASRRLRAAAHV